MPEDKDDNHWGWKAAEVTAGQTTWPGYVCYTSAQPNVPESLCRWAIYKPQSLLVVIALNGKIVGYENSGTALKAKVKIERICGMLGHKPVKIENPAQGHVKSHLARKS